MDRKIPTQELPRNPFTYKIHKRQVLWQITVPLAIGVLLGVALAALTVVAGTVGQSRWADISLILMIALTMVFSLLFLILSVLGAFSLAHIRKLIPYYTLRAQVFIFRTERRLWAISNTTVEPIIQYYSLAARLRALKRKISS